MRSSLPLALVVATLTACGGTSSETPWPIPPDERALGPAGERGAPSDPAPQEPPDAGEPEPEVEP